MEIELILAMMVLASLPFIIALILVDIHYRMQPLDEAIKRIRDQLEEEHLQDK